MSRQRKRVSISEFSASLTPVQQHQANDVNINSLMAKYRVSQTMRQRKEAPVFADFSNVSDYFDAQLQMQHAEELFMSLPAKVRFQHNNNPGNFLAWAENPDNLPELIKMGVVSPLEDVSSSPDAIASTTDSPLDVIGRTDTK